MIWNGITKFFLFWKWFRTEFRGFLLLKIVQNRVPRFCHPKMVQNGILWVFLFREMVQNGILRVFLFWEMVWNRFLRVFSSKKWFGTEFRGFFSSEKLFGTEFRGFSLLWNRRYSNGTALCSALFCIPRNNFLSENGNPNTWGVSTPSSQYIGESWPPVVDFLVYFELASEQVYKKVSDDKRPGDHWGVKTPQCINYRGVLTTCQWVLL